MQSHCLGFLAAQYVPLEHRQRSAVLSARAETRFCVSLRDRRRRRVADTRFRRDQRRGVLLL